MASGTDAKWRKKIDVSGLVIFVRVELAAFSVSVGCKMRVRPSIRLGVIRIGLHTGGIHACIQQTKRPSGSDATERISGPIWLTGIPKTRWLVEVPLPVEFVEYTKISKVPLCIAVEFPPPTNPSTYSTVSVIKDTARPLPMRGPTFQAAALAMTKIPL